MLTTLAVVALVLAAVLGAVIAFSRPLALPPMRSVSTAFGGVDFSGKSIDAPTSFHIGVAVNPAADDIELELVRFQAKIDAGAQFAMTQVLFEVAALERFLERLGGRSLQRCCGRLATGFRRQASDDRTKKKCLAVHSLFLRP